MVEEFMTGPEVSVESITINGETKILAITDKEIVGNGNFTEIGHSQPSALSLPVQEEIARVVRQTVAAIGINHSPSHTEIKVTPTGVKVVEIGARMGGDNITTHLVPLSTGVNMLEACINIAVGDPVQNYSMKHNTAAIRYFRPALGIIAGISGVEEARQIPGIREIQILRSVGERVTPIRSSTDRVGCVIAQGYGKRDAITICNDAMRRIRIDVAQE
jgi:biotin carboxylase